MTGANHVGQAPPPVPPPLPEVIEGRGGPLTGYRVIDLSGPVGYHALKLMADMGADVVKVEPPSGDPARMTPPFKDHLPHQEGSLYFLHYNTNKRGITLDVESANGREIFLELAKRADVIVETLSPGRPDALGIGYEAVRAINPGIVYESITPFGQTGPWRDYKATDIAALALSNTMVASGEPNQAPLQAPGELAYGMAGTFGAYGAAVALYHRMDTGEGQYIDVSMHAAAAHIAGYAVPLFSNGSPKPFRTTRAGEVVDLYDLYRAKDGFVRFFILPRDQWKHLVEWIGEPADPISDPIFENMEWRRENVDLIHGIIADFVAQHTKRDLYDEGQARRIAVTPVNSVEDFVDSPHTRARGLFVEMEHPVVGKYRQYGPVPRFSETPGSIRRTAPLLGQHNQDIYCGELGFSKDELVTLAAGGVI